MKRIGLFALALAIFLSALPVSFAAASREKQAADALYELGLFLGTGTDAKGNPVYELDRAPSRYEAVTMLVRLLGKEEEALAGTWDTPFSDLVDWAKPYVGYAYENGLTAGTGETEFSGELTVTAAQYLTFVLRALGYDSGVDFSWDKAWEKTDEIGLTDGDYTAEVNDAFLRGDVVVVSEKALDIYLKDGSKKLIETISMQQPEITIDVSGAIPAETGERELTEEKLSKLHGLTPEKAAASIFTLADAYAWLEQEGYSTHGMSGGIRGLANGTQGKAVSWVEMSTILNTLLEGDYDEVGTVIAVTFPEELGWDMFYISFNYVKTGGYYYITDPIDHLENTGWPIYRAHTIRVNTLFALKDALEEVNGSVSNLITLAVYPLFTERIDVEFTEEPMSAAFPNIEGIRYLYRANEEDLALYEKEQAEEERVEAARWAKVASQLKISDYGLPAAIGNTTLNYESAAALVGADPKVIASKVNTVGDVLQYMIAARFGYGAPAAYTPWYGEKDHMWGFDAPGEEQLKQNYGCCCGGFANTVSYLLHGDYEKVGTLRWIGGGNHTISWVYTEGKYYVFDFTQYCSGGNYDNYRAPVTVLDRLEDFYEQMPDVYSFFPKDEIVLMAAFEAGEAMYPSRWNDPPQFTGLTFPTEAEGKITVIYQKDPVYGVLYEDVNTEIPGWND